MGTWDIFPIAVNVQMLLEILNWIGLQVYGAPNGINITDMIRLLFGMSFFMGMITIAVTTLTSGGRERIGPFIKHTIIAMIIATAGFSIPVKLRINDLLMQKVYANPNISWTTGNVPLGIALPLFLTSQFEYFMTQTIEDSFTERYVPVNITADADYLKLSVGGGVGAVGNILLGLHSATAQDPRLIVNTMSFMKECLVPAVTLKVLPPSILGSADDILATIATRLLINYFADYENADGTIVTLSCDDFFLNRLQPDIAAANNDIQGTFVRAGFSAQRIVSGGFDVVGGLMVAMQSLLRSGYNNPGLSGNTTVLNAWIGRMIDMSVSEALGGGDPLVQAMSEKVREFKSEKAASGIMALTWLPKIKGALVCLFCAVWLPLVPFMLLHGNRVLISWSGMLLWLSLWGIILALINGIYTHDLVNTLVNTAPAASGANAITFGNRYTAWSVASESLAGMGMVISWVIPLSGIIMGWLSTKGFAAAGASQVVEQQVAASARGTGDVVSSRGSQDMVERNIQAAEFSGGGKYGPNPDLFTKGAKYNTARLMGRATAYEEFGNELAGVAQGEIGAQVGAVGENTIGSGFSMMTGLEGLRNVHGNYFDRATAGVSARIESFGGVVANQRSSLKADIGQNDSQMAEHRKTIAKMHGLSLSELERYGEALTGDRNWGQNADKTKAVMGTLSKGVDNASSVTRGEGTTASKKAHMGLAPGLVAGGSSIGISKSEDQARTMAVESRLKEDFAKSSKTSSSNGISESESEGIIRKMARNYAESEDLQDIKQKTATEASGYQEKLETRKNLSRDYQEALQLENGFKGSIGKNFKEQLFGFFVKSDSYTPDSNEKNIANMGIFKKDVASYMEHLKDDEKGMGLMRDYLKSNGGASSLTEKAIDDAFTPGGGNTQNVKEITGIKESEAAAAGRGKMFEQIEKDIIPLAQGMKEAMQTIGENGQKAAQAAGLGDLYDSFVKKITSGGPESLEAAQAAVKEQIAALETEKEKQIANHVVSFASHKWKTGIIHDGLNGNDEAKQLIFGWLDKVDDKLKGRPSNEGNKNEHFQHQNQIEQFNELVGSAEATINSALQAGIISPEQQKQFDGVLNAASAKFRSGDQLTATLGLTMGSKGQGADEIQAMMVNNRLQLGVGESVNKSVFRDAPDAITQRDMKIY